jgi:hypothetical protein
MVWGRISHGLKSLLIVIADNLTGVRYRDEILRPVAVPFVQQHHLIFQQDNTRPHVARVCQDFLANHNINPLDWPRTVQICSQSNICRRNGQESKGASECPHYSRPIKGCLVGRVG